MANVANDFLLLSNASATGSAHQWPGGPGVMEVVGTFNGATVALQVLGPDGSTYIAGGPVAAAAGSYPFNLPPGFIKAVIVGSPTGIYVRVAATEGGLSGNATGGTAGAGDASEASLAAVSATLGTSTASAAADTGASTVNGFLRKLRDIFVGAYKTAAAAFGTTGIGVMGSDGTNAQAVLLDTSGRVLLAGQVASDAPIGGNPVRIGARAQTGAITAVSSQDQVDLIATRIGSLIVRQNVIPELEWSMQVSLTNTSSTPVKALQASQRQYLTDIQVYGIATTVATTITILDGSTTLWVGNLPAGASAMVITFQAPLRTTAGAALNVQLGTTPTGAVAFNAQGYTAP